jgi:outer membrane protein
MMNNTSFICRYILMMFFFPWPVFAQSGGEMNLRDCIDLALKNNLNVRQAELNVLRGKNNLKQAKYDLLPNLEFSGNQNYNFGRSIDPFTNQFTSDPVRNNGLSLSAGINLFSGFQAQNQIKQNKALNEANVYNYQKAKNDIVLSVVTAYTQVIFNKENLNNSELQLKGSTEQADRTRKLVDAGSLPIGNFYDLKAQQATDELNMVNAKNAYDLAILNLKQLLNMPSTESLQPIIPPLSDPTDTIYPVSAEDIYLSALGHMPEIKSASESIKSAQIGIKLANGGFMPTLSAFASSNTFYSSVGGDRSVNFNGFSPPQLIGVTNGGDTVLSFPQPLFSTVFREKSFNSQLEFNRRENLGVSIRIPIFSRFQNYTNRSNAKIALKNAEYNEMIAKNQLRQTIERAHNDVSAASKRFIGSKKQLEAREEAFRTAEQRFNVGLINSVDYLLSQNNLNRARSENLQSKFDYIFKSKILDFYLNKPLEF